MFIFRLFAAVSQYLSRPFRRAVYSENLILRRGKSMANTKDYSAVIPKHETEALARCVLPEMQKYFESEESKREFYNN